MVRTDTIVNASSPVKLVKAPFDTISRSSVMAVTVEKAANKVLFALQSRDEPAPDRETMPSMDWRPVMVAMMDAWSACAMQLMSPVKVGLSEVDEVLDVDDVLEVDEVLDVLDVLEVQNRYDRINYRVSAIHT
jgi:hypothetical protein